MNLKNKVSKQEQTQNVGYRESFNGSQIEEGCGGMGEEVMGLRSTNRELQNSHGDVKSSTGNGAAKELICMTDGHEQRWGNCLREWGMLGGRGKKGENQDN